MLNRQSIYLLVSMLMIGSVLFVGCKKKEGDVSKTVISVKGSDTMVNLAQKWQKYICRKIRMYLFRLLAADQEQE